MGNKLEISLLSFEQRRAGVEKAYCTIDKFI